MRSSLGEEQGKEARRSWLSPHTGDVHIQESGKEGGEDYVK